MIPFIRMSLAALLLLAGVSAHAADPDLNGIFKLAFTDNGKEFTVALIRIASKDGHFLNHSNRSLHAFWCHARPVQPADQHR